MVFLKITSDLEKIAADYPFPEGSLSFSSDVSSIFYRFFLDELLF